MMLPKILSGSDANSEASHARLSSKAMEQAPEQPKFLLAKIVLKGRTPWLGTKFDQEALF